MTADSPDDARPLSRGELQDRAVKGALWTVLHTLVALPLAFVVNLVVAKVLQAASYGRLAVLTALMEVAGGIVALGLTPAVVQFGSKAHARGAREEVRRLLSAAQGFRLLVAGPVLTVVVLLVADVSVPFLVLAVIFGVWFPAALSGGTICLTLEHKTAEAARVAMVMNVLIQGVVLIVVLTARTPDSVWAGRLIASGLLITLALVPISRDYRGAVLRPRLPRNFPPGFWRFAVPAGLSTLVATLVLSRTEVFFLTALATGTATGLFALAFGVASHAFAPAQALIGPLIPAASGLREIDAGAVREAFDRAIRATTTVTGLLLAGVLAPLAVLVPVLYGQSFTGAAPLVLVLGFAGALVVVSGPVTAFVLARYSSRQTLVANLVALAVNVGLAIVLIVLIGVWGAVIANVAGAGTRLIVLLRAERIALGASWSEVMPLWTPVVVAAGASLAGWGVAQWVSSGPTGTMGATGTVLAAVLAGVVAFAIFLAGLRLTRSGLHEGEAAAITRVFPPRLRPVARRLMRATIQTGGHGRP